MDGNTLSFCGFDFEIDMDFDVQFGNGHCWTVIDLMVEDGARSGNMKCWTIWILSFCWCTLNPMDFI